MTTQQPVPLLEGTTPGPWQVNGSHVYATDPHATLIAQVVSPTVEADRRLIAAAPDLARENAELRQRMEMLTEAGQRVLDGLNARIKNAPNRCVPIFDGITDLHDALAQASEPSNGN